LEKTDSRHPNKDQIYTNVNPDLLPCSESLKMCMDRVNLYYNDVVQPSMFKGEQPVIVAHNNTIRGLIKTIKGLTKEEVMKVEIPNSIPIVFNFDDQMN